MNILFLCVGNSARSQIAEGLANSMFGSRHNIKSAGSSPTGKIHPGAVSVLDEIGIDISNYKSKSINDFDEDFIDSLDLVITLCNEEICPALPTKARFFHWINEDPANNNLNELQSKLAFRKTRDNIFNLLKKLMLENNL